MSKFFQEIKAEVKRLNTQATMELASGLFNNNAFVPYGPGQYTPDTQNQNQSRAGEEPEQMQQRESMGRE